MCNFLQTICTGDKESQGSLFQLIYSHAARNKKALQILNETFKLETGFWIYYLPSAKCQKIN